MTSNKDLEMFNVIISHDLRTPLRAIELFANLSIKKVIDPQVSDFLNRILKCTGEMSIMMDRIQQLTMMGGKQLRKEMVGMEEMVTEIVHFFQILENNKTINVDMTHLPAICADRILMREVWLNLISNAVKYSSRNSVINLEIGATPKDGCMEYYIKDNGVGFDMKQAKHLFKLFSRLHTNAEFDGTGAGLAIVKKIIRLHKGRVSAQSKLGEGATFSFTLPV
jgi:two-component system sensor histidine kinase/response regulator